MILSLINNNFEYELEKLCRIFLPFEKIKIIHTLSSEVPRAEAIIEENGEDAKLICRLYLYGKTSEAEQTIRLNTVDYKDESERVLAVLLYNCFIKITHITPQWGILTGVRPAKLFCRLSAKEGEAAAREYFANSLRVSEKKIDLCAKVALAEENIIARSQDNSFSLYISVPFCPSRCSYCSFVSHSVAQAGRLIPDYVNLLCEEIKQTAAIADLLGLKLMTVYFGGGTPTTLSAEQLSLVMQTVRQSFNLDNLAEYTVEAGRPDTVTKEKLQAIKAGGATRISINPQTLNDEVLINIGRKHTVEQFFEAFETAKNCGFDNINTDLIAGLPGDTAETFNNTLAGIVDLSPQSVTVHALSMKRASAMTGNKEGFGAKGDEAARMVDDAGIMLKEAGLLPYYMYRQSKTVGNLENTGYAKPGFEGLYNVYIMDETHTILACGASAVTKMRHPRGTQIERIFNFKYPYEYISRFSEIIGRKDKVKEFYEKYGILR